jgi:RNase H-fold protein (predicted Holliday junction resolvase)
MYEPEMFTSKEAERIQGRSEKTDASAAAIILQSYLDRNKNV